MIKVRKQVLRSEYKELIAKDDELQVQIAKALGRRVTSIPRWLKEDSIILTTAIVLTIIRKRLSLPESKSLTTEQELEKVSTG